MALKAREAFVFIDWDTARRCSWLSSVNRARVVQQGVEAQLREVMVVAAAALRRLHTGRVRAEFRVYHGWHRGNEPTADHRDFTGMNPRQSVFENIFIAPPMLGDHLACGGRHALLRDTLRQRDSDQKPEQKMVDTAIAADLLFIARGRAARNDADFLVLSEDDDMIPPVVVATHWGLSCKILRMRGPNRCMPLSSELLIPIQGAE